MWQVTAKSSAGTEYVYEVDAPDDASQDDVFQSACRQHGKERQERGIQETLDIRPGSYSVTMLYPQGHRERLDKVIEQAVKAGITLEAGDIQWVEGQPEIDGLDAGQWVEAMNLD